MSELGTLLDSYCISLDRMHIQLLSSADMLRLLMDSSACGHSIVHLEEERGLALQFVKGNIWDSSKKAVTKPPSVEAVGKAAKMRKLLDLVNAEARAMLAWLGAHGLNDEPKERPDAICAFLVQPSGACKASVQGSKPSLSVSASTKLLKHLGTEEIGMARNMAEESALQNAADGGAAIEQANAAAISEDAILSEVCGAMTCEIPARRKEVTVRRTFHRFKEVCTKAVVFAMAPWRTLTQGTFKVLLPLCPDSKAPNDERRVGSAGGEGGM